MGGVGELVQKDGPGHCLWLEGQGWGCRPDKCGTCQVVNGWKMAATCPV